MLCYIMTFYSVFHYMNEHNADPQVPPWVWRAGLRDGRIRPSLLLVIYIYIYVYTNIYLSLSLPTTYTYIYI